MPGGLVSFQDAPGAVIFLGANSFPPHGLTLFPNKNGPITETELYETTFWNNLGFVFFFFKYFLIKIWKPSETPGLGSFELPVLKHHRVPSGLLSGHRGLGAYPGDAGADGRRFKTAV